MSWAFRSLLWPLEGGHAGLGLCSQMVLVLPALCPCGWAACLHLDSESGHVTYSARRRLAVLAVTGASLWRMRAVQSRTQSPWNPPPSPPASPAMGPG